MYEWLISVGGPHFAAEDIESARKQPGDLPPGEHLLSLDNSLQYLYRDEPLCALS
jgi:hypothetical protein